MNKGKRMQFHGELIRGRSEESDPLCWHIAENPTAAGDFSACGVAFEEMEMIAEALGEATEQKTTGICTCEECIRQLKSWKEIISKAPAIMRDEEG